MGSTADRSSVSHDTRVLRVQGFIEQLTEAIATISIAEERAADSDIIPSVTLMELQKLETYIEEYILPAHARLHQCLRRKQKKGEDQLMKRKWEESEGIQQSAHPPSPPPQQQQQQEEEEARAPKSARKTSLYMFASGIHDSSRHIMKNGGDGDDEKDDDEEEEEDEDGDNDDGLGVVGTGLHIKSRSTPEPLVALPAVPVSPLPTAQPIHRSGDNSVSAGSSSEDDLFESSEKEDDAVGAGRRSPPVGQPILSAPSEVAVPRTTALARPLPRANGENECLARHGLGQRRSEEDATPPPFSWSSAHVLQRKSAVDSVVASQMNSMAATAIR